MGTINSPSWLLNEGFFSSNPTIPHMM